MIPPPLQTIRLVALPPLSAADRDEMLNGLDAIPGRTSTDGEARMVWTPTSETIESEMSSRGGQRVPGVRVWARIAARHRVALSGRTFGLVTGR